MGPEWGRRLPIVADDAGHEGAPAGWRSLLFDREVAEEQGDVGVDAAVLFDPVGERDPFGCAWVDALLAGVDPHPGRVVLGVVFAVLVRGRPQHQLDVPDVGRPGPLDQDGRVRDRVLAELGADGRPVALLESRLILGYYIVLSHDVGKELDHGLGTTHDARHRVDLGGQEVAHVRRVHLLQLLDAVARADVPDGPGALLDAGGACEGHQGRAMVPEVLGRPGAVPGVPGHHGPPLATDAGGGIGAGTRDRGDGGGLGGLPGGGVGRAGEEGLEVLGGVVVAQDQRDVRVLAAPPLVDPEEVGRSAVRCHAVDPAFRGHDGRLEVRDVALDLVSQQQLAAEVLDDVARRPSPPEAEPDLPFGHQEHHPVQAVGRGPQREVRGVLVGGPVGLGAFPDGLGADDLVRVREVVVEPPSLGRPADTMDVLVREALEPLEGETRGRGAEERLIVVVQVLQGVRARPGDADDLDDGVLREIVGRRQPALASQDDDRAGGVDGEVDEDLDDVGVIAEEVLGQDCVDHAHDVGVAPLHAAEEPRGPGGLLRVGERPPQALPEGLVSAGRRHDARPEGLVDPQGRTGGRGDPPERPGGASEDLVLGRVGRGLEGIEEVVDAPVEHGHRLPVAVLLAGVVQLG